jgi:hypothetical protein
MRSETLAILNLLDTFGMQRKDFFADLAPLLVEEKFYTAEDVAARYSVTEQTVRNWAKDKKLVPTIKVGGGCLRYSASDLAEFEKKHPGSGEK